MITTVSIGKKERTELDKAIKLLKRYYGVALGVNDKENCFIKKPISWALYQTWKEMDNKKW